MFKRKSNAFTLIELIATLVIMAILALIVTPLVMTIIRKARISADKRSIDAYGRSIELAIASHLMDTGKFATSIDELTIEYSGDKVECETTQINPDSSVYLSNCKVNNREVTNYTYGTDKMPNYEVYNVGDEVTYKGVDYYVLKNSDRANDSVTLLKATSLTTNEVNTYGGVGTENNIVNMYATDNRNTSKKLEQAYDDGGYGGITFYENENCYSDALGSYKADNCKTDYDSSIVKKIVDKFAEENIDNKDLKKARLITFDEVKSDFGFEYKNIGTSASDNRMAWTSTDNTPSWITWIKPYWTMTSDDDNKVWTVTNNKKLETILVANTGVTVRPVVELYKNDGITRKNSGNN